MATTEAPETPATDRDSHVSRGIYAVGNSFKAGAIWGALGTAATFLLLTFGRRGAVMNEAGEVIKEANLVDKAAKGLEQAHEKSKEGFFKGANWVAGKFGKKLDKEAVGSATVVTAFLAGGLLGHVAQAPATVTGWRRAQRLNDRFEALRTENRELRESNALANQKIGQLGERAEAFKPGWEQRESDRRAAMENTNERER